MNGTPRIENLAPSVNVFQACVEWRFRRTHISESADGRSQCSESCVFAGQEASGSLARCQYTEKVCSRA
jgi:hypothetical protein